MSLLVTTLKSMFGINGNAFINKGAVYGEYNRNIEIIGLHLECNGVESDDFFIGNTFAQIEQTPGTYGAIKVLNAPQYAHNITLSTDSVEYIISKNTAPQQSDTIQP